MNEIEIEVTDDRIVVISPYDPDWPPRARDLGGAWRPDQKAWIFDARDRPAVEDALSKIYGWAPDETGETVTIRHALPSQVSDQEYRLLGQRVAWRPARDTPVSMAHGVVLASGAWAKRGGSVRNPELDETSGVVIELRDIPVSRLDHLDNASVAYTVVDDTTKLREDLLAERDRLRERLAAIEAQLQALDSEAGR